MPGRPAPAKTPVASVSRVFFHIRDPAQRTEAENLGRRIAAPDLVLPGVQRLQVGPMTSELRYFHADEELEAKRIAALLRENGAAVALRRVPGYETKVAARTFEVWLAP